STYTHPATNPPNAVPSSVPSGSPPYPGCTACHRPNTTAISASAPRPADSGGPTRARRKASSSVTSATVVSATRKKMNAAAKPDAGTTGRSTTTSSMTGRSAAAAAAPYQRTRARCRVAATAPPQAATPASSARDAARSSRHNRARSASLPCQMSAAAHAAPTAKPRATSGAARSEPAGPHENPSGSRAASSAIRAHTPAASGTAVPPASCRTAARRGRTAAGHQRRHQPVEHVDPPHLREPLRERDRATRHRRRHGIADVDADAHGEPLQSLALPPPFAQNAGELAVVEQHIVGPFETADRPAEQCIDRVRDGQAGANRYGAQHGVLRAQQHAEPDTAGRGVPRAAVSPPAGGLLLGDHRGRRGRALEPELVNRIERRRELPEQPALRHAPPRRELRRRHAVQGHAILPATSATMPTIIAPLSTRLFRCSLP